MKHLKNNFIVCARFGEDTELMPIASFSFLPTALLVSYVALDYESLHPDCSMHSIIQVVDYHHYSAARKNLPFRVLFNVNLDDFIGDETL